ncbi:CRP-like cAMP-binding protein/membrane protease YdiL (CAAX protease family) [Paenibacillus phyllosphaerae]|uniref:CRP-like cAMP-binding protein/membrane protease YdiL (CAAX protease family) n=1 Tax=Paenibacillus phyllosphaerae TaxID=274593 RepID=A0A7W5AVT2_9BACL|nr:CRP-like cAMP-binding protein/membrane protease YdiL (CAAX protease family) [Paenibacillus phyllosphaerae]
MRPIHELLSEHPLLAPLTPDEIAILAEVSNIEEAKAGTVLIREGELDRSVYILVEGSAEVIKRNPETGDTYTIVVLEEGASAGEMALLSGAEGRRSATIRTRESSVLIRIDFDAVLQKEEHGALHVKLLSNIARDLSGKLNTTNQITVASMKKELETSKAQIAMGMFTVNILFMLGIYTLSFRLLMSLVIEWGSNWISVGILAIMATAMYVMIRRSGYPLHMFGLTLNNWRKVLTESFVLTLPLLVGITLAKWVVLLLNPQIDDSVFSIVPMLLEGKMDHTMLIYGIAYALFCPIQEFISRSGIQSALMNFLPPSKTRVWAAILLSNLLFAMAHTHLNVTFALLTLFPGLYWGWMYARQKSLLGASFSHILVGVWIFFVIGIDQIWNALF